MEEEPWSWSLPRELRELKPASGGAQVLRMSCWVGLQTELTHGQLYELTDAAAMAARVLSVGGSLWFEEFAHRFTDRMKLAETKEKARGVLPFHHVLVRVLDRLPEDLDFMESSVAIVRFFIAVARTTRFEEVSEEAFNRRSVIRALHDAAMRHQTREFDLLEGELAPLMSAYASAEAA